MSNDDHQYAVQRILDSDDFDGVARIGMAHRDWDGVVQVMTRDEEAGWWNGSFLPYLVFYRGDRPTFQKAHRLVRHAIQQDSMEVSAWLDPTLPFEPVDAPFLDIALDDPDSFEAIASLGIRWGKSYPHVIRCDGETDAICLRFYRDEADLPPDDFALDSLLPE